MAEQLDTQAAVVSPVSVQEFSKKVKEKYPEYKDVDDTTLAKKIVDKYPEYKDRVQFDLPEPQSQQQIQQPTYMQEQLRDNGTLPKDKLPEGYSPIPELNKPQISATESLHSSIPYVHVNEADQTKNQVVQSIQKPKKDVSFDPNVATKVGQEKTVQNVIPQTKAPEEEYFIPAIKNTGGAQINSNEEPILSEEQKQWAKEHPQLNSIFSLPGMGIFKEAYIGTKKAIGGLGTTLDVIASNISNGIAGGAQIDEQGNITYPWEKGYKQDKSEFYNSVRKFEEETPASSGGTTAFLGQLLPQTAALAATVLMRSPTATKAYLASMYGSSFGNGVETYDDYIKETGKQENPNDRYLVGMGYGAAEYIGEKVGLDYFMPRGYGKLVAKSLDASPRMAKEIGKSVLENYAKLTKQPLSAILKKIAIGSQIEGGQEVATELMDIAIDKWLTGKDVTGQEIRDRLLQSYGGGAIMGAGIAPFAHFSQNLATTERRRNQGSVTVSIDEKGLPIEIVQSGDKVFGIRPDGEEVKNISQSTIDKAQTLKTEDFEKAINQYNKTGSITTATIEGQQYTINNPEDIGQEGKPIFAKDAEGNVTAVQNHKVENPVTQTLGEINQANQQAAEQAKLYEGIADPNAQVTDDIQEGDIRLVKFSNGQSKIITPEGEIVANNQQEEDRILEAVVNGEPLPQPKVTDTGEVIQPAPERKIVTQKFGNTPIDIIEGEEYDEIVPTEKVPLEKALPVLEKKFKDNEDFELQVEKVQVEEPGETKYDKPVKKTVIKSIRIVPKVSENTNIEDAVLNKVSETQQQLIEQQVIDNLPTQESLQINQLSNEESENVNREVAGSAQQTENTPQEEQGQGVNEGLEENVNELAPPPANKMIDENGMMVDYKPNNTISFYHGGLNEDFDINNLDITRPAQKQQKKGRNYAGFYMYDESQKSGAETYSDQTGKALHRFDIDANANILELGNIERLTQEQILQYKEQGYDLLKGTDVRGRTEYVLLNKDVVKNVINEKTDVAVPPVVGESFTPGDSAPLINETTKTETPVNTEEVSTEENNIPDVSLESDQVQDVAGQESGQRPAVKEPWQMTREEFSKPYLQKVNQIDEKYGRKLSLDSKSKTTIFKELQDELENHKELVKQALSEGKPVPEEVLNDYPELKPVVQENLNTEAPQKVSFTYLDGSDHTGEVIGEAKDGKLRIKAEDGLIYRMPKDKVNDVRLRVTEREESLLNVSEKAAQDIEGRPNLIKTLDKISSELGEPVNIINSEEIPADVSELKKQIKSGNRIPAFFYSGQVYIISDQIQSVSDAVKSYIHETIIHKGLRNTFAQAEKTSIIGKQYTKLDDLLIDVFGSMSRSQKMQIANFYAPGLYENGKLMRNPTNEEKALIGEEFLAHISENPNIYDAATLSKLQEWINRLAQIIRKAFRLTSNQFSQNDLLDIIREQRRRMSEQSSGKKAQSDKTRFRIEHQSQIIQDARRFSDFEDFVDAYKESDFRDSHSAPRFDNTPTEEKLDAGGDFSLVEVANGFHNQPDDYFAPRIGARYYGYDDMEGMQSYTAISNIIRAIKAGINNRTITAYRAVPKDVKINKLIDGDWVTFSKEYAVGHGESRFGKKEYRIIKQEVDPKYLWWDGNDINEWGYDTGNTTKLGRADLKKIWDEVHGELRFRIIGETGAANLDKAEEATTRLDNLAVAREMEQSGKDVKSIRLATGWEKGVDGKWRYEVPDSEFSEGVKRLINQQKKHGISETWVPNEMKLNEVISDDELFKSYPEFNDVEVSINIRKDQPNKGSFSSNLLDLELGSINVQANNFETFKSILAHEIQHAIQDIEGFARGGSLKTFRTRSNYLDEYKALIDGQNYNELSIKYDNGELLGKEKEDYEKLDKYLNSLLEKANTANEDALNEYRRLAGEVESRNVQSRMNMTPEERLNTLLSETEDVAREDQIVLMDGLGVSNLEEQIPETIAVNGVEKPTRNSKGQFIHTTKEGIENFWKWFGDSKITNKQGKPLVLYHGTRQDFNEFGKDQKGFLTEKKRTFYFTPNLKMAGIFAGTTTNNPDVYGMGSIMPVYLKSINPKFVDNDVIEDVGYWADDKMLDEFESNGFDGLISEKKDQYVVLHPNQIKSATGNNGSFSPETNDIRFRIAESKKELDDFVANSEIKKTVYHGTDLKFDEFDAKKDLYGEFPKAVYFTSNVNVSKTYGNRIIKAKINLQNPYYFNAGKKTFNQLYDTLKSVFNTAINSGKDGVVLTNIYDDWSQKEKKGLGTTYAVFSPDQILIEPSENIRFKIEQERSNVNTEPSEAQRLAGNYQKGHVRFDGFDISIENPKGSVRSGVDKQGNEWSQELPADYGYFRGTVGKDKDHVDVFIGPKPEASNIYIIDQIDPNTGKFDEHKVMLGFDNQSKAKQTYLAAFEPGWKGLGQITKTDKQGLKEWFESGDMKKPFSDNPDTKFRIVTRDERFDQLREDLVKVSRFRTASENDLLKSVNETVESNMNESYGIKQTPLWERIKKKLSEVKESTQHFKFITEKEFPEVYDKLRQFESIPDRVKKEAYERVSQIVRPLIKNEEHMRAFERYIVLSDLVHDIEETSLFANKQLPWGYNTIDEIKQDMRNVRAYVMRTPQVLKAIRDRQAMMKEVKKELVANKLLKDNGNDNYFHHQVLAFMDGKANVGVNAKDVRNHKKGWQRSRQGSIALYNTNYVESEFEVMAQSLEQLAIKNMLGEINESINIMPQLIEKAQKEGGSWRDYIPDGYKFWFPKPGTNAYKAASMAEKAVNNLMNDPNNPELQAILAEAEGSMWVIPEPVAKQLDEMKDPEKEMIYAQGLRAMTNKWKQWTLLNPFRAAKYNFNNMSGDLDIVLAYNPKILEKKYAHSAMAEALNEMRGFGMSDDMKEALRYGVITSGLSIQEIPDINKESLFRSVTKGQGNWAKRIFGKTLGSYWSGVTAFTQFRENILRVAAYKFFKEQIKQGKQPLGVSNHDAIQALYASKANPNEIAGKLARELMGDYGNLSQGGQWIRAHSYPFWSWVEVNAPRYYRLLQNTKFEGNSGVIGRVAGVGAKKTAVSVGMLGVRVMLMTGLVMLWNQIMFPDEDDELQKYGDDKLKLIVGRREDGSIITIKIQGAFSDVLSFFSLEDLPSDVKELSEGKSTAGKKLAESGNAFVNKFAQGAMPMTRATMELAMGKSLYPDVFNPKSIRDRGEHAARLVSMDKLYNYLTHKPARSYGKEVSGLLVYDNNPGEAAYYTMREKINEFLKDNDKDTPSTEPSDKSNALYYYKKSLKFGDDKGAQFWFDKYRELGGTAQGYKTSMKKGLLLNSVPKELRGKWLESLDSEDKEILDLGNRWYLETYIKVGIPVDVNKED